VVPPFTIVVEMGFQSTGAKLYATMASSLRSGFILIPVLLILSKTRGLKGIQEALPLAFVITAIICLFFSRVFINRLNNKMAT
jgi:Na+-driven multidrug efflux pump